MFSVAGGDDRVKRIVHNVQNALESDDAPHRVGSTGLAGKDS